MKSFVYYTRGIDYKSFFDEKSKTKRYFVKGHIDSSDLDLVNDIVTRNCMQDLDTQLKSGNIKLDFDHETLRKGAGENDLDAQLNLTKIPLGKKSSAELDAKGNLVEFELNPNWKKFDSKGNVVMTFKEVWDNVKSGFYDAFSIAYVPINKVDKMVGNVKARMLDKINLINVALTGNPINPSATMTNVFVKSLDYLDEFQELKSELNEIKNMIGGKMTEEKNKQEVPNEEVKEEVKEEVVEAPKEEVVETEAVDEVSDKAPEGKSVEYVEVKSFVELKSKIDVLEKSLEKIDAILSKAIPKGIGAENKYEMNEVKENEVKIKSCSTLDLI